MKSIVTERIDRDLAVSSLKRILEDSRKIWCKPQQIFDSIREDDPRVMATSGLEVLTNRAIATRIISTIFEQSIVNKADGTDLILTFYASNNIDLIDTVIEQMISKPTYFTLLVKFNKAVYLYERVCIKTVSSEAQPTGLTTYILSIGEEEENDESEGIEI